MAQIWRTKKETEQESTWRVILMKTQLQQIIATMQMEANIKFG
jgi:hypothetical protein